MGKREETRRETMIRKYGSEEAYKQQMSEWAKKGGEGVPKNKRTFSNNPDLAREAGKKGAEAMWKKRREGEKE